MNKIQEGERLSFYQLFAQYKYKIVIPVIQREYAQGRKGKRVEEVRKQFLVALKGYLEDTSSFHDLDFIYGNLDEKDHKFIPLDGQQRLTTLFLLHYYLWLICDDESLRQDFKNNILVNGKSLFRYETRQSASDFCDALMNNPIEVANLGVNKENEDTFLSDEIKNQSWYFRSWKLDPTIESMLVMLDAIHKEFQGKTGCFKKLLDIESPAITFMFMELKKYKLTDDLYIKMNSRGKVLTPFENFKAQYEGYLDSVKLEDESYLKGKETLKEYFSHSVDTRWTDMLWAYKEDGNLEHFDQKLMNLIRSVFTMHCTSKGFNDDIIGELRGKEILSFIDYKNRNILSEGATLFLVKAFDVLYKFAGTTGKLKLLEDSHPFKENELFIKALRHELSYTDEIAFYAYLRYLIKYGKEGLSDWMRVVFNLSYLYNTPIDSVGALKNAIQSVYKMLEGGQDVLNYLKNTNEKLSFSDWQVKEERIKACLLLKGEKWRKTILEAEGHNYFVGQIGFILKFAGIVGYYDEHCNCDWSAEEDDKFFSVFENYARKAAAVFDANIEQVRQNNKDYCFERAVLTQGDYLIGGDSDRWSLLSIDIKANNIFRDYSWRRLLRLTDDTEKQLFVKDIFDDPRFDESNIEKSLKEICNDGSEEMWRDALIKHPELFNYSKKGFMTFYKGHSVLLLGATWVRHYHAELYTYALHLDGFEEEIKSSLSISEYRYQVTKSGNELPYIAFEFSYKEIAYRVQITATLKKDSYDLKNFSIAVRKKEGEQAREDYSTDLVVQLEVNAFQWKEDGFYNEETLAKEEILALLKEVLT